ncbi:MAG TPA: phosphatase PAP2 family protein [Methylomirabilota bacterium]|jgi:undecaprenyl-diphosphatase
MTSARARALLVAAGGAFVVLALAVVLMKTLPLDAELRAILLGWASPTVQRVMKVINYAGDWRVLLPATLLLLWLSSRARAQWWLWCALMVTAPLAEGVTKPLIGRARPEDLSLGFPSGHATAVGAFCGAVLYLAEGIPSRGMRLAVRAAALVAALLVAVARVMLRAHWPSDTLAGVALGLALASVAALVASAQAPLRGR